jgi:hypothetical protein
MARAKASAAGAKSFFALRIFDDVSVQTWKFRQSANHLEQARFLSFEMAYNLGLLRN